MYVIHTAQGVLYGPYATYQDACNEIAARVLANPSEMDFWRTCNVRIVTAMPA